MNGFSQMAASESDIRCSPRLLVIAVIISFSKFIASKYPKFIAPDIFVYIRYTKLQQAMESMFQGR